MNASAIEVRDPYYSRLDESWEAAEREDPVVWGDNPGPLTKDQLGDYECDGYISLPQLVSASEAKQLLTEANRMAAAIDPAEDDCIIEPGSRAVRSIFRVHRTNERFRGVCRDERVAGIARQILGSEVYLHQSRINFKPPVNGKEFFWHSDFETWHIEDGLPRMRTVSISINLTENHEFNGPLMLVQGSHHTYIRCAGETPEDHFKDSLRKQEVGVPDAEAMKLLVERGEGIVTPKGGPGSAVAFDCNTMHGSTGNLSPYARTNLFMVFNSVENRLVEPFGGLRPRPAFLSEREAVPVSQL